MQNFVPLGTGNSRLMKSNIPSGTTWEQAIAMLNSGTFPYDTGQLNAAGISVEGTPLNKQTLLQDSTAQQFGLTGDATVDQVLQILKDSALVKNRVEQISMSSIPTGTAIYIDENTTESGSPGTTAYYLVQHNYKGTANALLCRSASWPGIPGRTGDFDGGATDNWLNGDYYNLVLNSYVKSIMVSTTVTLPSSRTMQRNVFPPCLKEIYNYTGSGAADGSLLDGSNLIYPLQTRTRENDLYNGNGSFSLPSSAGFPILPMFCVPESVEVLYDGEYKLASAESNVSYALFNILGTKLMDLPGAQIATGSYVGTGQNVLIELSVPFTPKFLVVIPQTNSFQKTMLVGITGGFGFLQYSNGGGTSAISGSNMYFNVVKVTFSDNSASFWGSRDFLNYNGYTFSYLIAG